MCCDCTHPEALRATGNEKEQVVCVPLAGHLPGNAGSWSLSPCKGSSPGSTQMFAEVPPQQDQSQSCCSNSVALLCQLVLFPHEKLLFFWLMEEHSLLPAPQHLLCVLVEGSTKGLCGKHAQGRSWHSTAPTAAPELWQSTRVKTCPPLIGEKQICL